jgi:glycosyltransferase involved in cell wall biosynthesis
MKICILGQYPPQIGGVASHTYTLSKELQERGDEVVVLTYPQPDRGELDNFKVITAWAPNIKGLRGFFFTISAYFKLKNIIKEYNIDLIHAHFILPPGLVAVLAQNKNIMTAVTIHGSDIFILAQKPFLKGIIRWVLSRTDYVIVVNQKIKQNVEELGIKQDKIYITPNSVDLEKFNPYNHLPTDLNLQKGKPHILFIGNLVYQKGLEILLDAKKKMINECELIIVGDGPLRKHLETKVHDEEIPNVIFLGERRDVELIIPSVDLFVLPSISEGSPITILESLASGVPVVATDVGGVGEILTSETGKIVQPGSATSLAQVIDELLTDPDLRKQLAENCRDSAQKYSQIKIPY